MQILQTFKHHLMTEQELLDKYPEIFKEKDLPMNQSCMCWGLEVPTSWFPVIDQLCKALQTRGWCWGGGPRSRPQVVATQVKSKFGQLRFYFRFEHTDKEWLETATIEDQKTTNRRYDDYYQGMVDMANSMIYNMKKENEASK